MENFNIESLLSSIESKKVNLNWAKANYGLVEKMRRKIKEESSFPSTSKNDVSQIMDEHRLDKLFESRFDATAMNDIDLKHFQLKSILNELRQNFGVNITKEIIDQLIKRFLHENSEQFQSHRKEVFNFLMEILETRPPINAYYRWEWICIILSDFREAYSDIDLLKVLEKFSKEILKYFKNDKLPLEFKQFLLALLEYDYAVLCANNLTTVKDQSHLFQDVSTKTLKITNNKKSLSTFNQLPTTPRNNNGIEKMEDLDNYPLAYLILCLVNCEAGNFREFISTRLETVIVQDLLMHFHPKEYPLDYCRIYARLVGLLLDILLFVERQGDMNIFDVENDVSRKLKKLVIKIRNEHDFEEIKGKNKNVLEKDVDFEWRMFLQMAGVPWIG
ncbi:unnamed protein product [Meloidogyne enterolobii]|uniref:Uncharacterized protein n=1 Tax=Meloidogyne enterolobii TaxID=390850 RepID=A0ACB0Y483_MELEN